MKAEEREQLIDKYAAGAARLREALAKAPEEIRKWRPEPGEFSVHEIICHCADSETNSHGRIRFVIAEENATIIGYDPDVWAREFDYASHPLDAAMLTVEAVRANTVPLLRRLPEEAWSRSGTHTEHGPGYSAELWLRIYADHCHDHADQIERTIDAWRSSS